MAKRRKVEILRGTARFTGPQNLAIDGTAWTYHQAVIAVGSAPVRLPGWPEDNRIRDSTAALKLREVKKRLIIVGDGIIGLEMATVYAALGSTVTVVEFMDQIVPGADREAVRILHATLKADGITNHTGTNVASVKAAKAALTLTCEGAFNGERARGTLTDL